MGDDDNVKDLMTPRERLIVVREDQTVDRFEMIRLMNKNKIQKLVFTDCSNNIAGVVFLKDIETDKKIEMSNYDENG